VVDGYERRNKGRDDNDNEIERRHFRPVKEMKGK
jgi:hypothetical protein